MTTASTTTDNWAAVRAEAETMLGTDIVARIDAARQGAHPTSQLIAVLQAVQHRFGFLSRDHLSAVAQLLGVPTAAVTGVATFYHFFRLSPPGKHRISICLGTACYVKGATEVAERLKDELGVDFGETSKDGMFSLDAARCLGTCGLAPVVMIDDDVHGPITPEQIPALLEKYRKRG